MRKMFSEKQIKELGKESSKSVIEEASSGTIVSGGVLGLNSEGKLVKGSISGGSIIRGFTVFIDGYIMANGTIYKTDGTSQEIKNVGGTFTNVLDMTFQLETEISAQVMGLSIVGETENSTMKLSTENLLTSDIPVYYIRPLENIQINEHL